MTDIVLPLEGVEAEVVGAALAHYASFLAKCGALGGDAADVDSAIRPVVSRVAFRLAEAMYPDGEPEWVDPITAAKAEAERDAGDHHVYPAGFGR